MISNSMRMSDRRGDHLNNDIKVSSRLKIGTTGHRDVEVTVGLSSSLEKAIKGLIKDHPSREIIVLSPLAEGADRIIYHTIMKVRKNASLHALLPLEVKEYTKDFKTVPSKEEFLELLEQSYKIDIITTRKNTLKGEMIDRYEYDPGDLREISYEACGHLMVDMCDVLIAIWDGKKARGKGGTGEVVGHARKKGTPIIWIHSNDHQEVRYENFQGK